MRDFYDLYEIVQKLEFSWDIYRKAYYSTCKKRETVFSKKKVETELKNLSVSIEMQEMWNHFRNKNYFVENVEYSKMIKVISEAIMKIYE